SFVTESDIVSTLRSELLLEPGATFRGSVATFAGGDPTGSINWMNQVVYDYKIWGLTGKDHRSVGLWKYGIPTLFEYSHYITPPSYLFLSRMLARPIDYQIRNVMTLTVPDASVLQALGVRFVISDKILQDDFRLRHISDLGSGTELRLYELPNPNLAG